VVGNLLAFVPIVLVCLSSDPIDLIWLIIGALVVNSVQNYFIAPKLSGDAMNLHPLTVLIAMLAGGFLGGVAGLLLALPVTAALKVILNVFVFKRKEQGIYLPELEAMRESEKDGGGNHVPHVETEKVPLVDNSHNVQDDSADEFDKL
jgi:predicted PurR-regulated permease PerM